MGFSKFVNNKFEWDNLGIIIFTVALLVATRLALSASHQVDELEKRVEVLESNSK
jgi:hypothetical protein